MQRTPESCVLSNISTPSLISLSAERCTFARAMASSLYFRMASRWPEGVNTFIVSRTWSETFGMAFRNHRKSWFCFRQSRINSTLFWNYANLRHEWILSISNEAAKKAQAHCNTEPNMQDMYCHSKDYAQSTLTRHRVYANDAYDKNTIAEDLCWAFIWCCVAW